MVELVWYTRLRWIAAVAILLVGLLSARRMTPWADSWSLFVVLAGVVLAYNLALSFLLRSMWRRENRDRLVPGVAATGILLDLAALTCLTITTGGLRSPVVVLFVLHMVFVSLLMPLQTSYVAAGVAATLLGVALAASGQLPTAPGEVVFGVGWVGSLLVVAYVTDHIARTLRGQESEILRERNRSIAIFQTASDGIITMTPEGVITSANAAAERIFSRPSSELIGRPLGGLLQPVRAGDGSGQPLRSGLSGPPREMRAECEDGGFVPVEIAFSEVALPGGTLYTGVLRDITARKRTEEELRRLNEQLRRQQAALIQHEKMTALGQMTAGVVHEIANPLSNMDSLLQLAQRRPESLTPAAADSLRTQIRRINNILQRMTSFAHPDQSGTERLPIDGVVESAVEFVRFDKRFKATEVALDLGCAETEVEVNSNAFQQVMVNLISNALDALRDVAEPRVVIRTFREGDRCLVQVADNGCGIPAGAVDRVFDPFFTTKPVGQGTGLGLSISYRLIEQMGGTIDVESREGADTTFTIDLPISDVDSSIRDFPGAGVLDSEMEGG